MCNLYRLTKPNHEVARLFDVVVGPVGNAGMGLSEVERPSR